MGQVGRPHSALYRPTVRTDNADFLDETEKPLESMSIKGNVNRKAVEAVVAETCCH